MEERNERDARVTRSNQEHFHSIITVLVFTFSLFYSVRDVRKERLRIEESRSQGGRGYERLWR